MIATFVIAGQSNVDQWFHAGDGVALEAFRQSFLALNPEYSDVQFVDAARGGSAMLKGSAEAYADVRAPDDPDLHARISENYWYDEETGTAGPNLLGFVETLEAEVAAGTEFLGVIWAQGEADTTYVGSNGGESYAEGLAYVLDALLTASDAPQVYIQALGDRAFYSESLHSGTSEIRAAQEQVAAGSDRITLATTIFDLDLRDSVHLTVEGYETAAERMAVAISTAETSPAVGASLLLDDTTILIQLNLAVGQVAAAPLDASAFKVLDGGTSVAISEVSVTEAGLLRVVTASAITAPDVSYAPIEISATLPAEALLYVSGASGVAPVLPFIADVAPPEVGTSGSSVGLSIAGTSRSETLEGLSGDDLIEGGAGHDQLIGGWGSDTLTGGSGKDVFVMSNDAATDLVTDFDLAADAIGLVGATVVSLSFSADGVNSVSVTGPGGARMVLHGIDLADASAITVHTLGTDADNWLTGSDAADRIYAKVGDDVIDAGAGTDRIWTGAGADTVVFGTGTGLNVVYDFDLTEDRLLFSDVAVADVTAQSYGADDLEFRTTDGARLVLRDVTLAELDQVMIEEPAVPQVATLIGTDGNDVLTGSELDELFIGLSGTDRLYGKGGSDVFDFAPGSDLTVIYDFAQGQDRILVDGGAFDDLTLLTYRDSDAEIRNAEGDRLVLRNVDVGDLSVDDFVFEMPDAFL